MDEVPDITIAQAKASFLRSVSHSHSARTVHAYSNAVDAFLDMLANQQLDVSAFPIVTLQEHSIEDFVVYTRNLSPATESLYLQVIKNFFEFLDAERLTRINLSRVKMLMHQRTRRIKSQLEYPEEEIKRFIDSMSKIANGGNGNCDQPEARMIRDLRDSALILTLADTGLRAEEACKLKIGDIDWTESRALIHGRGGKRTSVRFSTRVLTALRSYLDLRAIADFKVNRHTSTLPLFARHDKGTGKKIKPITPTTVRNIVADRVDQILGAELVGAITPHTFLHYFITTILRATGNLKLAQVLARHTNIQVTQKYAHLSDDELDKGYYEIFEKKG